MLPSAFLHQEMSTPLPLLLLWFIFTCTQTSDKISPALRCTLYQHGVRASSLYSLQSAQRRDKREAKFPPFLHGEQILWSTEIFRCFADLDLIGETHNHIQISSSTSWSAVSLYIFFLHNRDEATRPVSLQVKLAPQLYAKHCYQKPIPAEWPALGNWWRSKTIQQKRREKNKNKTTLLDFQPD